MEKKSSELYVDERGYAHDDEGNTTFVGRDWAGHYPGNRLPSALRSQLSNSDDDYGSSYSYRPRAVNKNQLEVLTRLEAKKPGDFVTSVKNQVSRGYALSAKQVAVVVKMLSSAKLVEDIQHFDRAAWEKAKQPAPSFTPGVRGMNPQLDALNQLLKLKPGDIFLTSIRDQLSRGRTLSEAQLKAVRMNFYRASMKGEADLFRQASPSTMRVVLAYLSKRRT